MKKLRNPIFVTQPELPPLEEFYNYLKQIWDNKIITNNGPFLKQFEKELAKYLGVKYISIVANGTLALMIALRALRITGEVITTPFSFVATSNSLLWNNIEPVFVDIESDYFNLDPDKIEAAITPQTTAIMPVHVYGNPCKVKRLKQIANRYGLKLIYDAAHAFGVKLNGDSILNYGDISILSFHAIKVFNTIEGGAIICHDKETKEKIDYLRNFGFTGETTIIEPGINAKMNELQAAYGLLQLKYVDEYITKRKIITETYRKLLKGISGIHFLNDIKGVHHNYSFFPILIDSHKFEKNRDEVYEELRKHNIFCRRYFYPLISNLEMYHKLPSTRIGNLPIANRVAKEVLCLPVYPNLQKEVIKKIIGIIKKNL